MKTLSDSGSLVENGSFEISSQNSPEISAFAQAKFFSMLSILVTPHTRDKTLKGLVRGLDTYSELTSMRAGEACRESPLSLGT